MSEALRQELMEIRGVGEATADEIVRVLDENHTTVDDTVRECLCEAWDYYQIDRPGYAEKYLREAMEHMGEL